MVQDINTLFDAIPCMDSLLRNDQLLIGMLIKGNDFGIAFCRLLFLPSFEGFSLRSYTSNQALNVDFLLSVLVA